MMALLGILRRSARFAPPFLTLLAALAATAATAGAPISGAPEAPDPAMFERLAERFGWMAALLIVAFLALLALVVLVVRSLMKSQRNRDKALETADRQRAKAEEERERRLTEAIMGLTKGQEATRDAVTRQTAVLLATTSVEPRRVDEIISQLTAPARLCSVCPLHDIPDRERERVVDRARWCALNYSECLVNRTATGK